MLDILTLFHTHLTILFPIAIEIIFSKLATDELQLLVDTTIELVQMLLLLIYWYCIFNWPRQEYLAIFHYMYMKLHDINQKNELVINIELCVCTYENYTN